MTDAWDDMRKAKEESYFDKKNREAVERLAKGKSEKPRLSPITGEPMEQKVIHGVVIDQCPKSGGIWLDAGELEQLIAASQKPETPGEHDALGEFFRGLKGLIGGSGK